MPWSCNGKFFSLIAVKNRVKNDLARRSCVLYFSMIPQEFNGIYQQKEGAAVMRKIGYIPRFGGFRSTHVCGFLHKIIP